MREFQTQINFQYNHQTAQSCLSLFVNYIRFRKKKKETHSRIGRHKQEHTCARVLCTFILRVDFSLNQTDKIKKENYTLRSTLMFCEIEMLTHRIVNI